MQVEVLYCTVQYCTVLYDNYNTVIQCYTNVSTVQYSTVLYCGGGGGVY